MADEIPLENRVLTDSETVGGTADIDLENPPWSTATEVLGTRDWRRNDRTEALRAASRIVAAQEGAGKSFVHGPMYETLNIAEPIARWLETGKR